ncbi:MAG: hypothetical protein KDI75_01275 [Xanthomonadales bacterium]|nr:hypothetical protein [Xanthomonadales bacterium]
MMRFLAAALLVALSWPTRPAIAGDVGDDGQAASLQARVAALEAELGRIRAELAALQPAGGTAATSAVAAEDTSPDDPFAAFAADAAPAGSSTSPSPVVTSGGQSRIASTGSSSFNPAITLILNGSVTHHSRDPESYSRAGFPRVGEGEPAASGFSLGESELSLAANVDDKFYGQLSLAVESEDGEDGIGVEEAFIDSTALPDGFRLRAGRFFSAIGYLNSHHAHTDAFFDRPLPYQAFLGNQYGDDGVQLRWVAPTSFLLELGAELFRGQNFPAGGAAHGGIGARSLFVHAGGDAGVDHSWLLGASLLDSTAASAEDGFSGDSRLWIVDGTWKWAPHGAFKDGGVTLRGEYFREQRDGRIGDPDRPASWTRWDGRREGAYVEAVYRFNKRWDAGYRYDRLWTSVPGLLLGDFDPDRHSLQLSWRNSEFSLFRLQLSRDHPDAGIRDSTATLQYQTALGAHGAHKF